MARTKKEPVTEEINTVKTPVKKTVPQKSVKEKELEAQLKELQKMMEEMKKAMFSAPAPTSIASLNPNGNYGDIVAPIGEPQEEVPFRQYIRVMSLTNHRLTISTEGYGNGTVFNFVAYGQIQSILYEDLAKIIHNNERFAREGFFFIMDRRVVKIHNMEADYAKILTKEQIDNVLNLSLDSIREVVRNTTPHIKETIASIVLSKLLAGEFIDLNKVRVISTETGKDIDAIVRNVTSSNENEDD